MREFNVLINVQPAEVNKMEGVPLTFLHNSDKSTYLTELLWWFNEIVVVKLLDSYLAQSRCSVKDYYGYFPTENLFS